MYHHNKSALGLFTTFQILGRCWRLLCPHWYWYCMLSAFIKITLLKAKQNWYWYFLAPAQIEWTNILLSYQVCLEVICKKKYRARGCFASRSDTVRMRFASHSEQCASAPRKRINTWHEMQCLWFLALKTYGFSFLQCTVPLNITERVIFDVSKWSLTPRGWSRPWKVDLHARRTTGPLLILDNRSITYLRQQVHYLSFPVWSVVMYGLRMSKIPMTHQIIPSESPVFWHLKCQPLGQSGREKPNFKWNWPEGDPIFKKVAAVTLETFWGYASSRLSK